MTIITTSTAPTATAYSNQRKIDRTSNGVLWSVHQAWETNPSAIVFIYSLDDGATWTLDNGFSFASTTGSHTPNVSFFIDVDDYAHVVYKDRFNGYIYYRRGTPNAGRTAWTWSAATEITSFVGGDCPDVVAHREGTGWVAHIVFSTASSSPANFARYARMGIASGSTITVAQSQMLISGDYDVNTHTWPSIDFHHTGDGKTVAGATPHLYVAWSAGATGAGKGVRFKKATYAGGSWTWGTEREIDSTRYASSSIAYGWAPNCLFDGTRVVIGGTLLDGSSQYDLMQYERDSVDTATTTRLLLSDLSLSAGMQFYSGSMSYDSAGNTYFVASSHNGSSYEIVYRKWTRATDSLSSENAIATRAGNFQAHVSAKRGYSNNRIEFVYTDGTSSPYDVTYGSVLLNTAPNAPTLTTLTGGEVIDRAAANRASHSFSDPDAGDSQSAFDHRYRLVGSSTWTEAYVASPNTFHDYPAGTFAAGDYERQVRTYDAQGVVGPWSASGFFTAADAPATPTITDPIQNDTIGAETADVTWSAPDQDAYQLQVLDGGLVEHDTGTVVRTERTARGVPFPDNNVDRSIRVRVRYGGLWSSWYTIAVAVSYTRPPTPTVQLTAAGTALVVQVVNPAPGAGEPAVVQNDVFVTDNGQEERRAIVTPNGSWTYKLAKAQLDYSGLVRVEAVGDNGTRASS